MSRRNQSAMTQPSASSRTEPSVESLANATTVSQSVENATSTTEPKHAEAPALVRFDGPLIQASPMNQRVDLNSTAWAVPEHEGNL